MTDSALLEEKLNVEKIIETFKSGEKDSKDLSIGLEYERIPIVVNTNKNAQYEDVDGICSFLQDVARADGWDYITDNVTNNIIGLKQMHDTITLEPGCQVELSIQPESDISDLKQKVKTINSAIMPLLDYHGITLLNYGVQPSTTYPYIKLIPKKRYHLMQKYMWGILSDVMMRETAGIQCGIDFTSEEDMAKKFNVAQKMSPFMTAMFANSPIRGGVDTGYKSFRALSWLNTDNDRCGFFNNFEKEFTYKKYVERVLKTPMIFVSRGGNIIDLDGKIDFAEYMRGNYNATMEDFELQANLCFPDVRLRKFIEIRNHDCVDENLMWAIPAIYKGIMYNQDALNYMEEFLETFNYSDICELRYNVVKLALDAKIKNFKVLDIAKEILVTAENSLKVISPQDISFLEGIKELTFQNLTPAEIILKNWYGLWRQDINKFVKSLARV